jgi:prepilin-type N-terminal cleavage/methylation domain-containing protein
MKTTQRNATKVTVRISCSRRLQSMHRAGFTLTELLVVIGIIGVLASILFVAIGRAQIKGHGVFSRNNLKQLSTGYIGHDVELGGFMPHTKVAEGTWVETLTRREGYEQEVFHSPASSPNQNVSSGHSKMAWRTTSPDSTYEHLTRV